MNYSKMKFLFKILFNVFFILFGVCFVGGNIAMENYGAISAFLNQPTSIIVKNDDEQTSFYYLPEYFSIGEVKEATGDAISAISEEGCVLLKNENNALPLKSGDKVNLYSSSSQNYIYSGGGSSYAKKSKEESITLKDGLEESGLVVNENLWKFYSNTTYFNNFNSSTSANGCDYKINDADWSKIDNSKNDTATAGIFVLSRYGTEASDETMAEKAGTSGYSNGDYLQLAPAEISVLKGMKAQKDAKKLSKIIVLLNSVNQVQLDYADNPEFGIDAILWVGEGGTTGTRAIGKILTGKVNPSGKLPDTYFKEHSLNPVYANYGAHDNLGGVTIPGGTKSNSNIVYQEGIYNGYRYTETRYFDKVKSRANVGDFSYNDVVAYPFGYGLSYTTFSYVDFNATFDSTLDEYTLSCTVKNTGNTPGKIAVEFFVSKPYTQYDIDNNIEKSAIDFVGYGKSKILTRNQQETVSIKVKGSELASYDSYKEKTYIVDEGDYYFTAASDAHVAVNNILALQGVDAGLMVGEGKANFVKKFSKTFDKTTYAKSKETGKPITNQFDNADLNLYKNRGSNSVTYISRNNWAGTVKFGMTKERKLLDNYVKVTANSEMANDAKKMSETIQKDDVAYPNYGVASDLTLASMLSIGDDGKLQKISYEDERWDTILDKMTFDEQVLLLSNGLRKTAVVESIGKPETVDGNGAIGPVGGQNNKYNSNDATGYAFYLDDVDQESCPYQYPCSALVSATRNDELVQALGNAVGEDCLWCGYSGLYGLGVNLHRGMYSGRMFEYYSEDGVLSGKIAASEVRGIRARGVYVYMKHGILNETESKREGLNTWANEQSIRELYVKPFEIAIKEAGAECVMTAFNRIGVVWTSQHGFLNTVFRDEFDMQGFAVSDYWQSGYMNLTGGIMGGCALPDGDTATSANKSELYKYKTGYGKVAWAMREEVHRILYTVINSNAMNGISASNKFISITPMWVNILNGVKYSTYVIFGISSVGLIAFTVLEFLKKRRGQ